MRLAAQSQELSELGLRRNVLQRDLAEERTRVEELEQRDAEWLRQLNYITESMDAECMETAEVLTEFNDELRQMNATLKQE